jgi:hypothetical protein
MIPEINKPIMINTIDNSINEKALLLEAFL